MFGSQAKHFMPFPFSENQAGGIYDYLNGVDFWLKCHACVFYRALQNLPKIIAEKFPYMLHKQSVLIELYIKNVLQLTVYIPAIRSKILAMVTERLIFLDVSTIGISS